MQVTNEERKARLACDAGHAAGKKSRPIRRFLIPWKMGGFPIRAGRAHAAWGARRHSCERLRCRGNKLRFTTETRRARSDGALRGEAAIPASWCLGALVVQKA